MNGDFSIYLKSCIGMMLSERHSCIQGQDGQRAQSFTRRRNRKGHSHVVSTCCVADAEPNTGDAVVKQTVPVLMKLTAWRERMEVNEAPDLLVPGGDSRGFSICSFPEV